VFSFHWLGLSACIIRVYMGCVHSEFLASPCPGDSDARGIPGLPTFVSFSRARALSTTLGCLYSMKQLDAEIRIRASAVCTCSLSRIFTPVCTQDTAHGATLQLETWEMLTFPPFAVEVDLRLNSEVDDRSYRRLGLCGRPSTMQASPGFHIDRKGTLHK
jgi:hypothetical protein